MQYPNPLGDFSKQIGDNTPHKTSTSVRSRKAFIRLSASIYSLHTNHLGRALSEEETRVFLDPTYLDIRIPDEDDDSIDARYLSNDFINSDIPEQIAASRMDVLNSVDISDEEVESVKELISKTTIDLKDTILKTVVSYIALDNASAIVEAIMRDGVGVNVTVASSVVHSLGDMTKLSVLQKLLEFSDLDEPVKRAFMLNLTRGLTSDITPLRKAENGQRYSQILQNLVLSQKSHKGDGEVETNPMGILKRFAK
jgi:hypothetical protein